MKSIKLIVNVIFVFFIYSLSMLFSKFASSQNQMLLFLLYYVCSLGFMGIYAILWQFILKKVELSKVFPYKSLTILFGMLFGMLFFDEKITGTMLIGTILIFVGVTLIGSEHS